MRLRVPRRVLAGDPPEDEQVRQRVAAEPVGPVHPRRALARREEALDARLLRLRIDADAAHRVVRRRPDLHRLLRDVDVAELHELVVHRRELALDVLGAPARVDVEEDAAVRRAAPGLHFAVDGARHDVARQQIRRTTRLGRAAGRALLEPLIGLGLAVRRLVGVKLGDILEHDALRLVPERRSPRTPSVMSVPRTLGGQDHPGRVKLHELHVHELRAGEVRERLPVARALPRVRVHPERAADTARREDHGPRPEDHEPSCVPPVAERAAHATVVDEEARDRALHVDLHPGVDAVLLERPDHFEAGAIADVGEARVLVAADVALQDSPVGRAVEERPPRLELLHAVGRLHRVELRHAPLIEVAAALHRVAEVDLPVVLRLDVAERRRHPALGHHRVGLAEERLADQADAHALGAAFDGGAQACPTRPDDEDVVLVGLEARVARPVGGRRHQKSLTSVSAPVATMRM